MQQELSAAYVSSQLAKQQQQQTYHQPSFRQAYSGIPHHIPTDGIMRRMLAQPHLEMRSRDRIKLGKDRVLYNEYGTHTQEHREHASHLQPPVNQAHACTSAAPRLASLSLLYLFLRLLHMYMPNTVV